MWAPSPHDSLQDACPCTPCSWLQTHAAMWLFAPRKTPADLLRENKRTLDKAIRELDRERTSLQARSASEAPDHAAHAAGAGAREEADRRDQADGEAGPDVGGPRDGEGPHTHAALNHQVLRPQEPAAGRLAPHADAQVNAGDGGGNAACAHVSFGLPCAELDQRSAGASRARWRA